MVNQVSVSIIRGVITALTSTTHLVDKKFLRTLQDGPNFLTCGRGLEQFYPEFPDKLGDPLTRTAE